jgi:hypothetical protein
MDGGGLILAMQLKCQKNLLFNSVVNSYYFQGLHLKRFIQTINYFLQLKKTGTKFVI